MNKHRQKTNGIYACAIITSQDLHNTCNYHLHIEVFKSSSVADLDICWHIQRCELFQTKVIKMTSLKIFLVLVLVHEGKNNYSLVLVLVKMEYYILV